MHKGVSHRQAKVRVENTARTDNHAAAVRRSAGIDLPDLLILMSDCVMRTFNLDVLELCSREREQKCYYIAQKRGLESSVPRQRPQQILHVSVTVRKLVQAGPSVLPPYNIYIYK